MGQTGADFGAVSTDGLVQRVRRKIDTATEQIDKIPLLSRNAKDRRKQFLGTARAKMEAQYLLVRAGAAPEEPFRAALIGILDPKMAGGNRRIRFRW
jgi:hypothetical protein